MGSRYDGEVLAKVTRITKQDDGINASRHVRYCDHHTPIENIEIICQQVVEIDEVVYDEINLSL